MSLYVVIRAHGPAWDSSRPLAEQDGWTEHAEFMDVLAEERFLRLAGPLGVDAAMLVIEADGPDAIHARLDADPWTPSGHLTTASIEPWDIRLDAWDG